MSLGTSAKMRLSIMVLVLAGVLLVVNGELQFVIHFVRHGARGPMRKLLPNQDTSSLPLEQLTPVGMRQLFMMGHEFRRRYIQDKNFLPANFDPGMLRVEATAVNRTVQSALAFLSGLYPIGTGPKFDYPPDERAYPPINDVDFKQLTQEHFGTPDDPDHLYALPKGIQPIPVHMRSKKRDFLLHSYDEVACPMAKEMRATFMASDDVKNIEDTLQSSGLYQQLSDKVGTQVKDIITMGRVMDTLMAMEYNGMNNLVPTDTPLWEQANKAYQLNKLIKKFLTKESQQLFSTKLFADIISHMESRMHIAGKEKPAAGDFWERLKWITYSIHDTTVNMMLSALEHVDWKCHLHEYTNKYVKNQAKSFECAETCKYACAVVWELHSRKDANLSDPNSYYVKILYDDQPIQIDDKDIIPFPVLKDKLMELQSKDFQRSCFGVQYNEVKTKTQSYVLIIVLQVLTLLVLLLITVKLLISYRRMKNSMVRQEGVGLEMPRI